jgi:hypothetical protein
MLQGKRASNGRCEFTVSLDGFLLLLFIEFKTALPSGDKACSNVIAQVIAEADGANTFNMTCKLDGFPIYCILTDGKTFEFFTCYFKEWRL